MKILNIYLKIIFLLTLFLVPAGCDNKIEDDPCLKTKWPLAKEFEIKLAVHIKDTNPLLSGGSVGSQKPEDFESMVVSGTIEKFECSGETDGTVNLGNTYLTIGVDDSAPIDVAKSYWIGHVVYVYDFDNDKDYLNLNLIVTITMVDGRSYTCNFSEKADSLKIIQVPQEMYYYILLDVYSDSWVKV